MRRIVIEGISCLLVLLFVYAAVSKLLDYQKFTIQIGQSPVLSGVATVVAPLVIAIELMVAIGIMTSGLRLLALYAAFSLMVMFTVYIIIIIHYSPYVPCSCGGVLEDLGWNDHLVFNVAFTLLCIVAIILQFKERQSQFESSSVTCS